VKDIAASAVIGVLLSLLVLYVISDLHPAAVTLVVILCIGIVNAIGQLVRWVLRRKSGEPPKADKPTRKPDRRRNR
jgi:uncharacterized membrane protein YfcA